MTTLGSLVQHSAHPLSNPHQSVSRSAALPPGSPRQAQRVHSAH